MDVFQSGILGNKASLVGQPLAGLDNIIKQQKNNSLLPETFPSGIPGIREWALAITQIFAGLNNIVEDGLNRLLMPIYLLSGAVLLTNALIAICLAVIAITLLRKSSRKEERNNNRVSTRIKEEIHMEAV